MEIKDNRCSNCGGELNYDPTCHELKCKNCDSIVDIPDQKALIEKKVFNNTSTIKTGKVPYYQISCSTCGRKHIFTNEQSEIYNCPSCGAGTILRTTDVEYMPNGIIPFKFNKQKALEYFKDWIKKQKFAPNNLKKLAKTQKITGVYYPSYSFDFDAFTSYSGVGIRYYRDSEGHTKTTRHPFNSNRNEHKIDVLESANNTLSTLTLRKVGNYNYQENLYVYRTDYLYGWLGEGVDVFLQEGSERMRQNMANQIKEEIRRSLHYDRIENFSCATTFSNIKYNYLYLPIWHNQYTYNKKTYNCYINGETGKVDGKAPKSFWKIFFTGLIVIAIIGAIAYLIIRFGKPEIDINF